MSNKLFYGYALGAAQRRKSGWHDNLRASSCYTQRKPSTTRKSLVHLGAWYVNVISNSSLFSIFYCCQHFYRGIEVPGHGSISSGCSILHGTRKAAPGNVAVRRFKSISMVFELGGTWVNFCLYRQCKLELLNIFLTLNSEEKMTLYMFICVHWNQYDYGSDLSKPF